MVVTLRQLLDCFPPKSKSFAIGYAFVTSALVLLDVVALGALVLILNSLSRGEGIELPILGNFPEKYASLFLAAICILFVAKGVSAIGTYWYSNYRLAKIELEVGDEIFNRYLNAPWEKRSILSTPELTRLIDGSVSQAVRGFLGALIQVPGSLLTSFAVLLVLFIATPASAIAVLIYLSIFMFILFRVLSTRSKSAGERVRQNSFRAAKIMSEMLEAIRELTLRDKFEEIENEISSRRAEISRARGQLAFYAVIPRYALEIALIGGILIVGWFALSSHGENSAFVEIGIFGAVAMRLIPSMVMLQGSLNAARGNQVYAEDVIHELKTLPYQASKSSDSGARLQFDSQRQSAIRLIDVTYQYPGAESFSLNSINLTIPIGSRLALVGPSGSGKSTIIDVLLGLREPKSGSLILGNSIIDSSSSEWRRKIGYVPQRVAIFDGTLAQNIALTWSGEIEIEKARSALVRAQIVELLERPGGFNQLMGERGESISGGQRQRLGLARALYADPEILVLDEATSALDTSTEFSVLDSIQQLGRGITVISVAHRLSTIMNFEQICYIENGSIQMIGTFEQVRNGVPAFASQAELAGL